MDEYQHALYFEAGDLTERDREKIRRHFQIKRNSGGGDCGMIEKTGHKTYKICFKEKDEQEMVLQRKFHTISLPYGELCLTVSRTNSPENPDQPSTCQSQTCTKTSTKSIEKTFKPDIFLLYYMRDSPKANKALQKQLSFIGCTVEFNLDKEEAVVKRSIEKGSEGDFDAENWEQQVDQVFIKSYLCHYVVEPKALKVLLQDLSFESDEIKVYTENGYAVVVGETEAVKERIAPLQKSLPTRKEISIEEKVFKLVEGEFNQEMLTHYPEVKICRVSATIILEGPEKEVQLGATKLDELIEKVKVKRVKFCTTLINFIKSSSAISKYQTRFQKSFRNLVSLEVGSDLVLSSLSSDALDEAEATLQRDLSLANASLQGTDLNRAKEIIIKAKNDANCQELRVDVSFIPGPRGVTKVQFVGYSENVNKLKDALHDYQMNEVQTKEVLKLPYPELVDCFDKVLNMIGVKQTKVTLQASHFPYPCVHVSGPRCLVQEVWANLNTTFATLKTDSLILDGLGAHWYFQAEGKVSKELVESSCRVLIRHQQGVGSSDVKVNLGNTSKSGPSIAESHWNTTGSTAVKKTSLVVKLGSLVDEQVNVLVVPMLNRQLLSTKIGECLLKKAGNALKSNFEAMAFSCPPAPGDVLQVGAPSYLGCNKLFFIECLPWDGPRGKSVQLLGKGLKTCLDLCVQQSLCSVAFPVIGPGIALKYPITEATQVLTENIRQFGLSASSASLSTIHIVIKPGNPNSEECYQDVYRHLSLNMNHEGQAIFRTLKSDLDDITMMVGGGVKLQLLFGDITNETTEAVVNTTDFVNFQNDGVCKDILTVAGPEVEDELRAASVNRGQVYISKAGSFPCKAILHVCGEKDAGTIEQLVIRIIECCEHLRIKSVAIPAICAGAGGLDPVVVAGAILRGVRTGTSSTSLSSLTEIHLVLIKIDVFLTFKEEAMQIFSTIVNRVPVPQVPDGQQVHLSVTDDLNTLLTTSTSQKSTFLFLGSSRKDVDDAMTKLKSLYHAQCSTQTLKKEELAGLGSGDVGYLKQLLETQGLHMLKSSDGSLTVSGLKDGVNQVAQMIHARLQSFLRGEVRVREEEDLFTRVAWCILGQNGNWERVPKVANRKLEMNDIGSGLVDAQGVTWSVDLQRMEAKLQVTGQSTKLKRLVNLPDFTFPLYWDNMADGEDLKMFTLPHSSAEYRAVKAAFKRTVSKSVKKIERVQNVHLRRAYEVQKKNISEKNSPEGGAGEKLLYHGTTQDNCDSITKTGFDRRFAGQNATAYGHGTYFAVNANYSANPTYSKPAADGSQLMFVARVLTGVYALGQSNMKVPPPRSDQQPHNRCDSVVDVLDNPSIYVVFHDNQAYPDYLITFK